MTLSVTRRHLDDTLGDHGSLEWDFWRDGITLIQLLATPMPLWCTFLHVGATLMDFWPLGYNFRLSFAIYFSVSSCRWYFDQKTTADSKTKRETYDSLRIFRNHCAQSWFPDTHRIRMIQTRWVCKKSIGPTYASHRFWFPGRRMHTIPNTRENNPGVCETRRHSRLWSAFRATPA